MVYDELDDIITRNKKVYAQNTNDINTGKTPTGKIDVIEECAIINLYENGKISESALTEIFTNGAGVISQKDFNYFALKKMKLTPHDTPEIIEARYFSATNKPLDIKSAYYNESKDVLLATEIPRIEKAAQEGKMIIVTGLPGAGKTTVVRNVLGAELDTYYMPDADTFKEGFSAYYNGGKGAGLVHKASTTVLKQEIMPKVIQEKRNLIYQTTGGQETLNKVIEQARVNGYTVEIVHVNVDETKSMERALGRFIKEGRFLDPYVTLSIKNEGNYLPNEIPNVFANDSRLEDIIVYNTNGTSPIKEKVIEINKNK